MDKRPHIGILTGSLSRRAGGMLKTVGELSQALKRSNQFDLEVIGLRDRWSEEDASMWRGLPVHLHQPWISDHLGFTPSIKQSLKTISPDLLHLHGIWFYPSWVASRWKRKTGRPEIITLQGMLDGWTQSTASIRRQFAARAFERDHLAKADCIHALTQAELQFIREFGLSTPVCVIPNGVELPVLTADVAMLPPWKDVIPGSKKVLLYVGRLQEKKGLPNFLRAWASTHSSLRHDWNLALVGWSQDGHESLLRNLISELGLGKEIHLLGAQHGQSKEACFRHADAFALPSLSEGMPLAVLEAWSYELPVLLTPECNLPEGVNHGAAIESKCDQSSLAHSLETLFRMSDSQRKEMGIHGRSLVAEKFTWTSAAEKMAGVYDWLLGKGVIPECVKFYDEE